MQISIDFGIPSILIYNNTTELIYSPANFCQSTSENSSQAVLSRASMVHSGLVLTLWVNATNLTLDLLLSWTAFLIDCGESFHTTSSHSLEF